MTKILFLPDGSRFVASLKSDIKVYDHPSNDPSGRDFREGTDLLAHKTQRHGWVYYTYFWSRYQGVPDSFDVVSKDEAIRFIAEHSDDVWGWPEEGDLETIREVGLAEALEETA
jgi:hypothetical protein